MEFMGYLRSDGQAGTRNATVILPTIGCANELAWEIAQRVEGTVLLTHNHACIRVGKDQERAHHTLRSILLNPNVGGALIVGLGCEPLHARTLLEQVSSCGKRIDCVSLDEVKNADELIEAGVKKLRAIEAEVSQLVRTPQPVSKLTLGIKCGGSGAVSAIASNPAVGYAADLLVKNGARVIFTETAELIGAEHVLAKRAATPEVKEKLLGCVRHMMDEIDRYGVDILGSEPTQGNIKNGLTTIEEKSLGAISKGGTSPLMDVLEYGHAPEAAGLYFMDGTTQASQLFLGMFSAGAQIQIFSYAGGLPARMRGLPSYPPGLPTLPVLKVLGSCADADEKEHFDIYAGDILTAKESIQQVGQRIYDKIIATASGEACYTEKKRRYTEMLQIYADGLLM